MFDCLRFKWNGCSWKNYSLVCCWKRIQEFGTFETFFPINSSNHVRQPGFMFLCWLLDFVKFSKISKGYSHLSGLWKSKLQQRVIRQPPERKKHTRQYQNYHSSQKNWNILNLYLLQPAATCFLLKLLFCFYSQPCLGLIFINSAAATHQATLRKPAGKKLPGRTCSTGRAALLGRHRMLSLNNK